MAFKNWAPGAWAEGAWAEYAWAPPIQVVLPTGVSSAGSWTAFPSGTIAANVIDSSDTTGAISSTGTSTDTLDLSFPAINAATGNVTFYIRHRKAP
jgi:hypothetical protein